MAPVYNESSPKKRKSDKKERKRKNMQWNEENMASAIAAVKSGMMPQRKACQEFQVPRSTLQDRLSNRVTPGMTPGRKTKLSNEQEKKLVDYACNRAKMGTGFRKQQFLRYSNAYAKKYDITFKNGLPSDKWWRGMRRRHKNLSMRKPEPTASIRHQCMNNYKVAKYFYALDQELKSKNIHNKPTRIWNMDEVGIQLDYTPDKVIAETGSKYVQCSTSGNKETITVVACINANGDSLPPHLIVKGKTHRTLQSFRTREAPPGTMWSASDSGWTKQGIAKLWFTEVFLANIGPDRPQLLILDGHEAHNWIEIIQVLLLF